MRYKRQKIGVEKGKSFCSRKIFFEQAKSKSNHQTAGNISSNRNECFIGFSSLLLTSSDNIFDQFKHFREFLFRRIEFSRDFAKHTLDVEIQLTGAILFHQFGAGQSLQCRHEICGNKVAKSETRRNNVAYKLYNFMWKKMSEISK